MQEYIYLNGSVIEKSAAVISPDDRGFLLSDGVYDVVRCYHGRFFRFAEHIDRLKRSLNETRIIIPQFPDFEKIARELLEKNRLAETQCMLYIQITRGAARRTHTFPPVGTQPTVYATLTAFSSFQRQIDEGISVITKEDIRWHRCDIKAIGLLPNTMAFDEAVSQGSFECIFVRNGLVTEASHSNVFGVINNVVLTHPADHQILHGITRRTVLELCRDHNIAFSETPFSEEKLYQLDELMVVGTGSEVMPVVRVNGRTIGNGSPGPVARKLQMEYNKITYGNK